MELELNRTALPYHDLIFHTQVTREETMEMIVPDAYPDISKLLDTSGICCLNTREASGGDAVPCRTDSVQYSVSSGRRRGNQQPGGGIGISV